MLSNQIFVQVLNMSLTASVVILVVLFVRALLFRFPKKYSYVLWLFVGIRLVCPFAAASPVSIFNVAGESFFLKEYGGIAGEEDGFWVQQDVKNTGDTSFPAAQGRGERETEAGASHTLPSQEMEAGQKGLLDENAGSRVSPQEKFQGKEKPVTEESHTGGQLRYLEIGRTVWIAGMAVFFLWNLMTAAAMQRRLRKAVRYQGNIYECDNIASPFVMGLIKPKIYIPFHLGEIEREYILRHEQYHIKRRDYIVKFAAFLILTVYWFHPLVWVACHCMVRDMEMSCDEYVLAKMGTDIRCDYSKALLHFATNHRSYSMGMLAFGETDVRKRVKNIMKFHKHAKWIGLVAVIVIAAAGFVCLTNAEGKEEAGEKAKQVTSDTKKSDAAQDVVWDYDKEIVQTEGVFTYHAYPSQDGQKAWIYKIKINNSKLDSLSIPAVLDGKSVTGLGYINLPDDEEDSDTMPNLFGVYVEPWHGADGRCDAIDSIKNLTIPDSVEVIEQAAFSGMDALTAVTIPAKVTILSDYIFYGCNSLGTVNLPDGLTEFSSSALRDCPELKGINFSSENSAFIVKENCVIAKEEQALVYALPGGKTMNIPNGVKSIKAYSFNNCLSSTVKIPASVTVIEGNAFHIESLKQNIKIKNVIVSQKNKVYARDGQCIYNKKKKSLSVAIPNDAGVLRISDKVTNLTSTYSMVNCDTWEEGLKKVIFPKNLKSVTVPAFSPLSDARAVYFTGAKPPKIKNVMKDYASLPIFTDIYVPKASAAAYKKWYKTYDCYNFVDSWHTFDPKRDIA